jgi:NADH:ubiquinone oxidoreductase subunit K
MEELKAGVEKKSSTDYPFLDRFGAAGTLVALEIKLILRNKRPRATVSKGLIFLFYGFLFYKNDVLEKDEFGRILFAALFMTGNMILLYGQFMFGWQGAEFDGLLANKTDIRTFFKAKLLMLTLSATLLTFITSLYGLMSWKLLVVHLAAYLYNVGIGAVIVLYFATRNYKYIDLKKGSSFNWQGVGASSMLMSLPILLLPYLIYFPVALLSNAYWGLAAIGIIGIAGLLTRNYWLNTLVSGFNKRKYKIAAGFREQS